VDIDGVRVLTDDGWWLVLLRGLEKQTGRAVCWFYESVPSGSTTEAGTGFGIRPRLRVMKQLEASGLARFRPDDFYPAVTGRGHYWALSTLVAEVYGLLWRVAGELGAARLVARRVCPR